MSLIPSIDSEVTSPEAGLQEEQSRETKINRTMIPPAQSGNVSVQFIQRAIETANLE